MSDLAAVILKCADPSDFSRTLKGTCDAVPAEIARRLMNIFKNYFGRFEFEEVVARMNNRSVGQILAEFDALEPRPIASGAVDEVRYELYEAPDTNVRRSTPSE